MAARAASARSLAARSPSSIISVAFLCASATIRSASACASARPSCLVLAAIFSASSTVFLASSWRDSMWSSCSTRCRCSRISRSTKMTTSVSARPSVTRRKSCPHRLLDLSVVTCARAYDVHFGRSLVSWQGMGGKVVYGRRGVRGRGSGATPAASPPRRGLGLTL